MSDRVAALQPPVFWLGGGEADLKCGPESCLLGRLVDSACILARWSICCRCVRYAALCRLRSMRQPFASRCRVCLPVHPFREAYRPTVVDCTDDKRTMME